MLISKQFWQLLASQNKFRHLKQDNRLQNLHLEGKYLIFNICKKTALTSLIYIIYILCGQMLTNFLYE